MSAAKFVSGDGSPPVNITIGPPPGSKPQQEASKEFRFQQWLDLMKSANAYEIAQPIKTFLTEFTAGTKTLEERVTSFRTFMEDMGPKIASSPIFQGEEPDMAIEGLEKYLMNKLYKECFQPQFSDDKFRDEALSIRISMLEFVRPEHLDIPPGCVQQTAAVDKAGGELIRMETYKAPRDKLICVMNCCRAIINILKAAHKSDEHTGADGFLPLLIYVILKTNPANIYSNLMFIERFRDPSKLVSEQGYYFTNMMSAVNFIQKMDANDLSIDPHAYEAELTRVAQSRSSVYEFPDLATLGPTPVPSTPPRQPQTHASERMTSASSAWSLAGLILDDTPATKSSGRNSPTPAQRLLPVLEETPARSSVVREDPFVKLLEDCKREPIARFLVTDASDLTLRDVPVLLSDYKRLAELNERLVKMLQLNVGPFAQ